MALLAVLTTTLQTCQIAPQMSLLGGRMAKAPSRVTYVLARVRNPSWANADKMPTCWPSYDIWYDVALKFCVRVVVWLIVLREMNKDIHQCLSLPYNVLKASSRWHASSWRSPDGVGKCQVLLKTSSKCWVLVGYRSPSPCWPFSCTVLRHSGGHCPTLCAT